MRNDDNDNVVELEPIPKIDKHLASKCAVYTCGLQGSQTSSDYQKDA
jgi:hypothetical protein